MQEWPWLVTDNLVITNRAISLAMVAISRKTISMITASTMNDIDAPIEISTGSVENGPAVFSSGTGVPKVGMGFLVVVVAAMLIKAIEWSN